MTGLRNSWKGKGKEEMVRKKAFGIFGGFLAVMLVFTLISRAVSGAAMARVTTVKLSIQRAQ